MQTKDINVGRPEGAIPVPSALIQKYNDRIGSVWWFAQGRETDPTIGVEIDGIRKTFSGYVHNSWWYFMKMVHPGKTKNDPDQCFWYRKRRVPDPNNPETFTIDEEYVGKILLNPDTDELLEIPEELEHKESSLCV